VKWIRARRTRFWIVDSEVRVIGQHIELVAQCLWEGKKKKTKTQREQFQRILDGCETNFSAETPYSEKGILNDLPSAMGDITIL
jgi:hypothetical protein